MAKGSRYRIERAIGPTTIENNSYFDIAKSSLFIKDGAIPVPSRVVTSATANLAALTVGKGALLRLPKAVAGFITFSYLRRIERKEAVTDRVLEIREEEVTPTISSVGVVTANTGSVPSGFTIIENIPRASIEILPGEVFIIASGSTMVTNAAHGRVEITLDD